MNGNVDIRNFCDPLSGGRIQPYYAAFMICHGHKRVNEQKNNVDYILWIQGKWREFRNERNYQPNYRTAALGHEFTDWLQQKTAEAST